MSFLSVVKRFCFGRQTNMSDAGTLSQDCYQTKKELTQEGFILGFFVRTKNILHRIFLRIFYRVFFCSVAQVKISYTGIFEYDF
jgi:hypothetical protein